MKVALTAGVFGDWKPDIVLSGINAGPNTGQSIHYSGTVGAAREANINGYPSIALSLSFPEKEGIWHYQWAAEQTVQFLEKIRECRLLEKCPNLFRDVCININFPNRPFSDVKGWKVTKQGSSGFKDYFVEEKLSQKEMREHPTRRRFRIEGSLSVVDPDDTYDTFAMKQGWICVTCLGMELHSPDAASLTEELVNETSLF